MTDFLSLLEEAQSHLHESDSAAQHARQVRDDLMLDAHLAGATYEVLIGATGLTPKSIVAGLDRARIRRGLPTSKQRKADAAAEKLRGSNP